MTTDSRSIAVQFLHIARAGRVYDEPAWHTFRMARLEVAAVGLDLLYDGNSDRARVYAEAAHLLDERQARAMRTEAVAA